MFVYPSLVVLADISLENIEVKNGLNSSSRWHYGCKIIPRSFSTPN